MSVAFPETLPRPQRSGYGYQVASPIETTGADRGMGRMRRVGQRPSVQARLRWIFSDTQLAEFAAWWRNFAWFGTQTVTIILLNAYNDVAQDVIPLGAYTQKALGGRWEVELPVNLLALPIATQAEMQSAIDNYNDMIATNALHQMVHITMHGMLYP